jgi:outer membrane lipoprotein SlyB
MTNILSKIVGTVLLAAMLTARPGWAQTGGEVEIRQGVIEQITASQIHSNHHSGLGAVVGGVAGLGIGSLIGRGTGREVAMVVGTIGGAVAGNEVQKRHAQPVEAQQVIVRLNSGILVAITQPVDARLKTGQKVYIEGNGEKARVVPRQ